MKIKDKKSPLTFRDLNHGDVFQIGVNLYMKMSPYTDINAVLLESGLAAAVKAEEVVMKLEHELVIK